MFFIKLITSLFSLVLLFFAIGFCFDTGTPVEIILKIITILSIFSFIQYILWHSESPKHYFRDTKTTIIVITITLSGTLILLLLFSDNDTSYPATNITADQRSWIKPYGYLKKIRFQSNDGDSAFITYTGLHLPSKRPYQINGDFNNIELLGYDFNLKLYDPDTTLCCYFGLCFINSNFSDSFIFSTQPFWSDKRKTQQLQSKEITQYQSGPNEEDFIYHNSTDYKSPIDSFIISRKHGPFYFTLKNGSAYSTNNDNK